MKDYDTWSFRDRSFALALLLSILWHLFWFLSISITVSPFKKKDHARPVIVSLGPVIDDTLMRTLIEAKTEPSEAFYRQLSDFTASATDLEVKTIERHSPGDVVSVPLGNKFLTSLRGLVGGKKSSPTYEFTSKIKTGYYEESFELEGAIKERQIVGRPVEPELPFGYTSAHRQAEIVLACTVEASGEVTGIDVEVSSGDAEIDMLWQQYLKGWQFAALPIARPALDQRGKVRFRLNAQERA